MKTSLYKLAEQVMAVLGKGEPQEIIESVRQSYGTAIKMLYFEGRKNELSELDGSTLYTFGDVEGEELIPTLNEKTGKYALTLPTSYVALPHEMGVAHVSYLKSQDMPFVRVAPVGWSLLSGLKSSVLGGHDPYSIKGNKIEFPKMDSLTAGPILMILSVGVDTVDVDEDINIPMDVRDMIVQMVVTKYQPKAGSDQTLNN